MPTVEEKGMAEDVKLNTKHIEWGPVALQHMHSVGEDWQKPSLSPNAASTVMLSFGKGLPLCLIPFQCASPQIFWFLEYV